MFLLTHGIHVAVIAFGVLGLSWLLGPTWSGRQRLRRLRVAAVDGSVRDAALANAFVSGQLSWVRRPAVAVLLLAYSFTILSIGLAVTDVRLTGQPWPSWPVVVVAAGAVFGAGAWLFRRCYAPRRVALAAAGVQVVLHPVMTVVSQYAAGRRFASLDQFFSTALLCHSVQQRPSVAELSAAAGRLGVALPHAPRSVLASIFSPSATLETFACLIVAVVVAYLLCLDRRGAVSRAAGRDRLDRSETSGGVTPPAGTRE